MEMEYPMNGKMQTNLTQKTIQMPGNYRQVVIHIWKFI